MPSTLQAGLAFLAAVEMQRVSQGDLNAWIELYLVREGILMSRPARIQEPIIGVLPGDKQCMAFLPEIPPRDPVAAAMVRARARVVGSLRGLIAQPSDDRFLNAAIFTGHVRRVRAAGSTVWAPRPRVEDTLSELVLGLFAADALNRRETYAAHLCVCDRCGRVRFDDDPHARRICFRHGSEPPSCSRRRIGNGPSSQP